MAKPINVENGKDLSYLLVENNLRVPDNQRDFTWKLSQAEDLWNDIYDSFKTETQTIFLGTFIFYLEELSPSEIIKLFGDRKKINKDTIHNIVDGQQRITTLYILLLSIRAVMKDGAPSTKIGIIQERMGLAEKGAHSPKYITSPKIHRIFHEIHNQIGMDVSHSRADQIGEDITAQRKWEDLLKDLKKKHSPERADSKEIKKNKKEMIDQIKFIQPIFETFFGKINDLEVEEMSDFFDAVWNIKYSIVECTDISDAFDIFERVNNRGTPLGITDLLKNHLFGISQKDNDITIIGLKKRWDELINDLPIKKKTKSGEEVEEETTMNAAKSKKWITNFHPTLMEHTRDQKQIMRDLKNQCDGSDNAERFLTKLEDFSKFFKLYESENFKGSNVNFIDQFQNSKEIIHQFIPEMHDDMDLIKCHNALSGMQHYGIKQVMPLIYCVLNKYRELNLWKLPSQTLQTKAIIPLFLKSLESFHFICTYIVGMKANRYEDIYQTYPTIINSSAIAADFFRNLFNLFEKLNGVVTKHNALNLFKATFKELKYEVNTPKITYILKRMAFINPKVGNPDRNNITASTMASLESIKMDLDHWLARSAKEELSEPGIIDSIGNLNWVPREVNNKSKDGFNKKTIQEKIEMINAGTNADIVNCAHLMQFVKELQNGNSETLWKDEEITNRTKELSDKALKIWDFPPRINSN